MHYLGLAGITFYSILRVSSLFCTTSEYRNISNGDYSSKWPSCACWEGALVSWPHSGIPLFSSKMPSHVTYVVPGCPNRKNHCKWGFFPNEEHVQGRKVYIKRRLCGSTLDKVDCGNTSPSCKSVSFHSLPKNTGPQACWGNSGWLEYQVKHAFDAQQLHLWYSFSNWSPQCRKCQSFDLPQ